MLALDKTQGLVYLSISILFEEYQAKYEQIEAEMEAEVEAKYEDFLDAQKYDPSLRA